jgi:hypothetical protein
MNNYDLKELNNLLIKRNDCLTRDNELLKNDYDELKKEYEKLMDKSNEQFKDKCILLEIINKKNG